MCYSDSELKPHFICVCVFVFRYLYAYLLPIYLPIYPSPIHLPTYLLIYCDSLQMSNPHAPDLMKPAVGVLRKVSDPGMSDFASPQQALPHAASAHTTFITMHGFSFVYRGLPGFLAMTAGRSHSICTFQICFPGIFALWRLQYCLLPNIHPTPPTSAETSGVYKAQQWALTKYSF